jgi:hypothetical protein
LPVSGTLSGHLFRCYFPASKGVLFEAGKKQEKKIAALPPKKSSNLFFRKTNYEAKLMANEGEDRAMAITQSAKHT